MSAIETRLLKQLVERLETDVDPHVAQFLLQLRFEESDHQRMEELSRKANRGTIMPAEREELADYLQVGDLLTILHLKARHSLKTRSPAA